MAGAHLLARVALQEGEEQEEALGGGHHAVALLQALACGGLLLVINAHVQRRALEGQPGQILHLQQADGLLSAKIGRTTGNDGSSGCRYSGRNLSIIMFICRCYRVK